MPVNQHDLIMGVAVGIIKNKKVIVGIDSYDKELYTKCECSYLVTPNCCPFCKSFLEKVRLLEYHIVNFYVDKKGKLNDDSNKKVNKNIQQIILDAIDVYYNYFLRCGISCEINKHHHRSLLSHFYRLKELPANVIDKIKDFEFKLDMPQTLEEKEYYPYLRLRSIKQTGKSYTIPLTKTYFEQLYEIMARDATQIELQMHDIDDEMVWICLKHRIQIPYNKLKKEFKFTNKHMDYLCEQRKCNMFQELIIHLVNQGIWLSIKNIEDLFANDMAKWFVQKCVIEQKHPIIPQLFIKVLEYTDETFCQQLIETGYIPTIEDLEYTIKRRKELIYQSGIFPVLPTKSYNLCTSHKFYPQSYEFVGISKERMKLHSMISNNHKWINITKYLDANKLNFDEHCLLISPNKKMTENLLNRRAPLTRKTAEYLILENIPYGNHIIDYYNKIIRDSKK